MKKIFPDAFEKGSVQEKRSVIISLVLAAVVLIIDQMTKLVVAGNFELHESRPVIDGIFSWTFVLNRGAAWGILAGRTWLLLFIALVVFGLIIRFFRYLTEGYIERIIALGLVISGMVGNSVDRIWHGAVIDFIDIHYRNVWSYPVFNVADIAICTGVGIFILSNLLRPSGKEVAK